MLTAPFHSSWIRTLPHRTRHLIFTNRRPHLDPVSLLVEALVLMALVEVVVEVAAAAQVAQEDALGGWMMFGDQSAAAVDESHKFAARNR